MIHFAAILCALSLFLLLQALAGTRMAGWGLPARAAQSWMEARRRARFAPQLAPALELFSGALRAGSSLAQALQSTAAESPEPAASYFSGVARALSLGESPETALESLAVRLRGSACAAELRIFAAAVGVTRQSGGNLAEIAATLAETLRERARLRAELGALTAQGRLSGWIVGCLPLGILAALYFLDPALLRPMFHTGFGLSLLGLGLALEAVGAWLISRIVRLPV